MPSIRHNPIRSLVLRIPKIRDLYNLAQQLRMQRDRLAIQIAASEGEKLDLIQHRDSLSRHVVILERTVAELREALLHANARVGELEQALEASRIEALKTNEPAMQGRISLLETGIPALHAQLNDATDRARALERERDILQARQAEMSIAAENQIARVLGKLTLLEYRFTDVQRSLGCLPGSTAAKSGEENRPAADSHAVIGRYLDLIEASLVGTLSGDPAMPTPNRGEKIAGHYDADLRVVGRDWPLNAATMIGTVRMRNLRHLIERTIRDDVRGDLIETGVWRGGACIYMRAILAAYGIVDRTVWVADSFQGLPKPNLDHYPADASDIHYQYQELAISLEEVQGNFERYGLLDGQVKFLKGWFKDTLAEAPIDALSVLRLDGDMYESTIQALEALYWKVQPGGFVIVDDFVLPPCREAVQDFRGRHNVTAPMEDIDGAAIFWQIGEPSCRQQDRASTRSVEVTP